MFNEYIDIKTYFDHQDIETSVGLSKHGHLIIEQTTQDDKINSVVIYKEILPYLTKKIEKIIKNLDNNNVKFYESGENAEWGVVTKCYVSSIKEDLDYKYDEIIISQNDTDNVIFNAAELLKLLKELKTNFKKNEGV